MSVDTGNESVLQLSKCCGLTAPNGVTVPLKSIEVEVNIKGYLAEVVTKLQYTNAEENPIEALFTFPVDDGSAVYQFEADIDGRHIVAEVQEREQAILTYKDAVDNGKTAMLLKEDTKSSDTFQCTLGNLPPGKDAVLKMSFVNELPQEADGKLRFTLPTVLNPRYSPDAGGSVAAEGATYVPPCAVPYKFKLMASVEGYHKIKAVTSDKLSLKVEMEREEKLAKVSVGEEFKFDHDLTLYIEYSEPFQPQVVLENGDPDREGLLKEDLLMVSFHPDLKQVSMSNSGEYIFIIDRSGSMNGDRIKNAKEALLLFLKSLPPSCHFNVVSFGSEFSCLFDGSEPYTEKSLKKALKLQKAMEADMGGTEMYKPLEHVLKAKVKNQPRNVFLLTDGDVGNSAQVISLIKSHCSTTRVFALGIGDGVSTSLVKAVVRAGNGLAEFIADDARIQPKVVSLLKCAMQPAVTNLEVTWNLPPAVSLVSIPTEVPAMLTVGQRLTFFALLKGTVYAPSTLTLKGLQNNDPIILTLTFTLSDDEKVSKSAPVHRLATKVQIKQLQDAEAALQQEIETDWQLQSDKTNQVKDLRKQIVDVSRHGNIISKFTSFVAVDTEGEKVQGKLEQRSCPIPTVSEEFVKGFNESMGQSALCDSGIMLCGGALRAMKLRSASPLMGGPPVAMAMCSAPRMMSKQKKSSSPLKGLGCGLLKRSKKQASSSAPMEDSDESLDAVMADETSSNSKVAVGSDQMMLEVITLQELAGNWTVSSRLTGFLKISNEQLKSKEIVADGTVLVTLAVIAWLRKHYGHRQDEWEMIETKAVMWLGQQGLQRPVEELIKLVTEKMLTA
ncbi:von Willebrand factor A domain-containing protein 5A-like isoform X2 [Dreissena polymorpha]|uniref:von Willebrand factor A domain-containing protein 5A-like isoform X2 n=1 Tax=Dreissena polymorpha TaxID=45954 RepID=UPI00226511A9|nr:von Willebrand factor A domain-containing protein 5A-like isoform X2 [Dreissena polymorpha]